MSWWRFLLAGSSLAAVTVMAVKIPWPAAIDLGDLSYWLVVMSAMTSITLVGIGIALAIGNQIRRQRVSGHRRADRLKLTPHACRTTHLDFR